jgi:1,4-alpha-glucan branching enzyme
MAGNLCLVLHAHLPFVRHPEHENFLEENWLYEAITECYLPLLQMLEGWERDNLTAQITFTLSPTLCAMLDDPLLQSRYLRYLDGLIELADKEIHRTLFEPALNRLAQRYHERLNGLRSYYLAKQSQLLPEFRRLQDAGRIEIITCAATHAVLPLLKNSHAVRAQILVARDDYVRCFGRPPLGIWLPECAYAPELEPALVESGLRWFITESHGVLNATPKARYALFAPILTERGLSVFGRDMESAKQVWSRNEGYPGDPRYRDFYRDIGYDVDLDYVQEHLPVRGHRGFTGLKYHAISKQAYEPDLARQAVQQHAGHFLQARRDQIRKLNDVMDTPPVIVSPYDAELFGHWWYEGPDFVDQLVRQAQAHTSELKFASPGAYLKTKPILQVAAPSPSTWGEGGHLHVWLNEKNHWMYPHLSVAQERIHELAVTVRETTRLMERALRQAGRELLLAQSSDWPFIIRTGTSPEYATRRFREHIAQFTTLYEQIRGGQVAVDFLENLEQKNNLFPQLDWRHWS